MGQGLRISLFGKLAIFCDSDQVIELEARRAQELFAYLLLHSDHSHEREKLATLMWNDKSTTRSRQYLRQVLWQVQSALQTSGYCKEFLVIDRDWIGMNPQAPLSVDVSVFAKAFGSVERVYGGALAAEQVQMLQEALRLYKGELLEGWYEDWCILERERYQNMYLAILDKLLTYSETHNEYEAGLAYGAQILRYDRAHERTHRTLMTLHLSAGNRSAAVHQYNACVAALQEELGVAPAESTNLLYQQICGKHNNARQHYVTKTVAKTEVVTRPLSSALFELEKIHLTLHQLQSQIYQLAEKLDEIRQA